MGSADLASRLTLRLEAAAVAIGVEELAGLIRYFELLRKWNAVLNLTALAENDEALDRLLVEPLAAAEHLPEAGWLVDVGSGGGSPAIPLKIVRPRLTLTMIEVRARKAAFLREAVRHLGVRDVSVEAERAEEWVASQVGAPSVPRAYTMRAVKPEGALTRQLAALADAGTRLCVFGAGAAPPALPGWRLSGERQLLPQRRSALWVFTLS